MNLPVFELIVNAAEESDVEVQAVALVDKPAIERNFLAFNSAKVCFTALPEQQIVFGPAMIPDTLIYRRDDQGEYNVFFSKDTISQIALKFFKKGYEKNINLFHDQNLATEKVTIYQSFISNSAMGISPMKGYEDLPDGTWFIGAKIEDPQLWAMVMDGTIKGFSVEGVFSYKKKEQQVASKLLEQLRETLSQFSLFTEKERMDIKELIAKFTGSLPTPAPAPAPAAPQTLSVDVVLKDGTAASVDKLEVGGVMLVGDAPCAAGEYELADGTKVTVGEGGVIAGIEPGTPADTAAPAAPDMSSQYDSKFSEINEKFNGYEQKFAAYEERFAKAEKALTNANETIVALMNIVEKLSEVPTADPVGASKNNFSSDKAKSKEEARMEIVRILNTRKK